MICLAVTPSSFNSFSKSRNEDRKGDYRGFLTTIDADYDPAKAAQRKDKFGFIGHFNVIDQLIWTDLFALKVNRIGQNCQEYWRLATQHPWGVYVGPTTGVLRKRWRVMGYGVMALARSLARANISL
jgi:hypothetical protein